MNDPALVRKYANGLAGALAGDVEYETVRADLERFRKMLAGHPDLGRILTSPFVGARARGAVLDEVVDKAGFNVKTARFLRLAHDHGRLGLIEEIARHLPEVWHERRGIRTYEVASVVPLTEIQIRRLERGLEASTGGPVRLTFRLDPDLLGGLSVRRGHIVYDASIRGGLERLQQDIREGT